MSLPSEGSNHHRVDKMHCFPSNVIHLLVSMLEYGQCERLIHSLQTVGDQFTGRCCTEISSLMKEFAMLPVHFDFTDISKEGTQAVQAIIEDKFFEQYVVEPNVFELIGQR